MRTDHPHRVHTTLRRAVWAALVLALLAPAGCASGPRRLPKDSAAYAGPPMSSTIARGGTDVHLLTLTAPGQGWTFTLDTVREQFRVQEVFVTIRRPNPVFDRGREPVSQSLSTGVPARERITVFARILEASERADDQAYRRVELVPAIAPPAP